jgi:hypothetical protein
MSKTIDDFQRRTNGPPPDAAGTARPETGEPDCNKAAGTFTMGVARSRRGAAIIHQAPASIER